MTISAEFTPSGPELIATHLEITGEIRGETQHLLSIAQEAETKPYILDNHILQRMDNLGKKNSEAVQTYSKQLSLWRLAELTDQQQIQVSVIEENITEITTATEQIGEILEKCRGQTIDDISEKDDFALGLEFLLGHNSLDQEDKENNEELGGHDMPDRLRQFLLESTLAGVFPEEPIKIPRNAPCPCGSGLKYKKCCLKLI